MQSISLRDFLQYRCLTGLTQSPDGQTLAFFVTTPDEERNTYRQSLWILDPSGGAERELCSCDAAKLCLWDAQSALIYAALPDEALRARIEAGEEWTVLSHVTPDGGEPREICRVPYRITRLLWVDETHCAAVVRYRRGVSGLGALSREERDQKLARLEAEQDYDVFEEIPFWANGKGLIDGVRERLFLLDLSTGGMLPLSPDDAEVGQVSGSDGEILFTANAYRGKMTPGNSLWRYQSGESAPRCLLPQGEFEVQYAARAGGALLVLGSDRKRFGISENPGIYELAGGGLRLLADDLSTESNIGSDCRIGEGICFQVYGQSLYFLSTVEHHTAISRFTPGEGVVRVFDRMGGVDGFTVGPRGLFFLGLQNDALSEVYRCEGGRALRLTSVNTAVMKRSRAAKTEWFPFSHNGVSLQGAVMLPPDYDPAKRYPGILTIHGGPKAAYGQVFYHELQLWAARGYLVFFTNPTGSDGRGNEFADIVGKQGTVDYDQLMAFTDEVLRRYPALDPSRLGVTGSSYGGFMTNWIIGHTDRFACAVAQCSIANWISKVMTTDIGYYFNTDQLGATPWSDAEKLWFHSPMKYADRIKTPTLFVHGQEDYRCWLCEPVQMFHALRFHGVEARMLLVHGEHHGMARGKPLHRIRRLEEILAWFDRFLQPGQD